jgi:ComF family protein
VSPRMTLQTRRFLLRRVWNLVLNAIFLDDKEACLLCQRPLYPSASHSYTNGNSSKADTIPGICLFCIQDVSPTTQIHHIRRIRLGASAGSVGSQRTMPIVAARRYEGAIRNAIRQWKYDGAIALTPWFATWAAEAYNQFMAGNERGNEAWLNARPTVMIPVPTSPDRFRKRGYHHVGMLADEVARILHLPVVEGLTRRPNPHDEFTQSQTAKNARERLQGLRGAYHVKSGVNVAGQSILLVDDIVTTGATLYMCACALLSGGAERVAALVLADVE